MTTENPTTAAPEELDDEAMQQLFDEISAARASGTDLPARNEKPADTPPADPAAAAPAPDVPPAPPPPAQQTAPQAPAIDKSKITDPATLQYIEQLEADRLKLEQERRAAVGRAAAVQRQLAGVQRQTAAAPPAPANEDGGKFKQLAQEFPEMGAAITEVRQQIAAEFEQKLASSTFALKSEALDGMFPGWIETMQSPEFHFWLDQQDEPTRKRYDSDSLRDYASLLRSYERTREPSVAAPPPPSEAELVRQQREQRMASATQMPSRATAPNPTGEPDPEANPEGYFNWLSARRDRARQTATR